MTPAMTNQIQQQHGPQDANNLDAFDKIFQESETLLKEYAGGFDITPLSDKQLLQLIFNENKYKGTKH